MRINYSGLVFLVLLLSLIQLSVNDLTIIYIDCFTLVMVTLLLNDLFSIRVFMLLSIFADLIGHWYLGTHLLAIILVSIIAIKFVQFYRTCHTLQRIILVGLFSLLTYGLMMIVDLIVHNNNFSWENLIIEAAIINPIIMWLMSVFVLRIKPGMIRDV